MHLVKLPVFKFELIDELNSSHEAKKESEWNKILSVLDTNIYCYNGPRDVRKNLIERSQKSDDEKFYVPKGQFINNKKDFVVEATNWFYYWNFQRKHMRKAMNGLTPFEKLQQSGLWNIKPLFNFPTLIFDDCISNLIYRNKSIKTASLLNKNPNLTFQKDIIDFNLHRMFLMFTFFIVGNENFRSLFGNLYNIGRERRPAFPTLNNYLNGYKPFTTLKRSLNLLK